MTKGKGPFKISLHWIITIFNMFTCFLRPNNQGVQFWNFCVFLEFFHCQISVNWSYTEYNPFDISIFKCFTMKSQCLTISDNFGVKSLQNVNFWKCSVIFLYHLKILFTNMTVPNRFMWIFMCNAKYCQCLGNISWTNENQKSLPS